MPDLRAVVVMDYQNVHLTGHELFAVSRHLPRHESLVDPLHFSDQLISARNRAQRPGMDHAVLTDVLVYRGQPSAEHDPKPYARNQASKTPVTSSSASLNRSASGPPPDTRPTSSHTSHRRVETNLITAAADRFELRYELPAD